MAGRWSERRKSLGFSRQRRFAFMCWLATACFASMPGSILLAQDGRTSDEAGDQQTPLRRYENLLISGKIVWLADAMQRLFGVPTVSEARKRMLALETDDGKLFPLAEDLRGRSFRKDERLRQEEITLLARRYEGAPVVQVVRIFERDGNQLRELDYWCEICAIAMFEDKPCDCCQEPIELRRRAVDVTKLLRLARPLGHAFSPMDDRQS